MTENVSQPLHIGRSFQIFFDTYSATRVNAVWCDENVYGTEGSMIRLVAGFLLVIWLGGPALAQGAYQIQPGDTLQVEVLEDPQLNRSVLVLPDGSFSFPLAGTVRAAGRSVANVGNALAEELSPNFAVRPTVLVSVASLATREEALAAEAEDLMGVYIVGEVNAPGRFEVIPGTTLLQFIAQAGGLSRFAAEKRLELRRVDPASGEEMVYRFNYRRMGTGGSISPTTVLAEGDVVVVPERRIFE